jgi:hypothetical protein
MLIATVNVSTQIGPRVGQFQSQTHTFAGVGENHVVVP